MPLTGDGYFAGEFPGGTTTVGGAPVSAAVLVYQRDSGQLIAQTESSQSGEWVVTGVDLSKAHDIVGRKEGFNDVIVSNVMPTSMVVITYTDNLSPNETFTGALGYIELVGGMPPYTASIVDPLPAGLFPVVNGRQLIIDGTTTDDDVFDSTVQVTSSNGATKDVPVKLVVGFKAPANFEAETIEDAGALSVLLTWEVTNTTQEVLVFRSTTPFDLESMPAPIAMLTGAAVSYTDDDVIEDDVFHYMVASVCESYTLYSDEVIEVVTVRDPHWDKVVALLHFDGDLTDETGRVWSVLGNPTFELVEPIYGTGSFKTNGKEAAQTANHGLINNYNDPYCVEFTFKAVSLDAFGEANPLFWCFSNGPYGDSVIHIYSATGLRVQIHSGAYSWIISEGLAPITIGVKYHLAITYDGSDLRVFLDGVLVYIGVGVKIQTPTSPLRFGTHAEGIWMQGSNTIYDELRITKGVARYTENFTPPTKPFPNH